MGNLSEYSQSVGVLQTKPAKENVMGFMMGFLQTALHSPPK